MSVTVPVQPREGDSGLGAGLVVKEAVLVTGCQRKRIQGKPAAHCMWWHE